MKKYLVIGTLLLVNAVFSQVPDWLWAKNFRTYFSNVAGITKVDNNGNAYLIGDFETATVTIGNITLTNNSDSGLTDAYLIKFDNNGTIVWSKQIGSSKVDSINFIDIDNFGNIYICGSFGNTVTLGATTLTGYPNGSYFAKLDPNGNYLWVKKEDAINESFKINTIKSDGLGNFFIGGKMTSTTLTFGNVTLSQPWEANVINDMTFVAKFDNVGNCLWAKKIPADKTQALGVGISINSLAPDTNGGVALCGQLSSNAMTFGSYAFTKIQPNISYYPDMFIGKYDNIGTEIWAYHAGNLHSTLPLSVATDTNNNVFVSGLFYNSLQLGTTTLSAIGSTQYFLAKYAANGNFQWVKTNGSGTSSSFTKIQSLSLDENDNIYAAGLTSATQLVFSNNVTLNLPTVGSGFVTKFDNSGTAIWSKGIPGINPNYNIYVDCKSENDIIVAGQFEKPTLQLGNTLLTKSTANYDNYIGRLATALNNSEYFVDDILIGPNPVNDILNITNLKHSYEYSLYNTLGALIKQGKINEQENSIDVSALVAGVYILQTTNTDGAIKKVKLVKD